MKTVLDFYNELPLDIKAKAVFNYNIQKYNIDWGLNIERFNNIANPTLEDALVLGFDWELSQEGKEYWNDFTIDYIDLLNKFA